MPEKMENRVALVTGGSRGIGKAIALALADAGAAVAVNYRERHEDAALVVDMIHRKGGRGIAVAADVSVADQVDRMIAEVGRQLGAVDILVNNAGIAPRCAVEDMTETDFDRTIAINLKSAFLCTQAVLPHMRAQRWGRIINMSSIAGRATVAGSDISIMYTTTKAALEGLTRSYAGRLATEGVTVNAIAPGLIETDLGRPLIEAGGVAAIPIGRCGTGEDIAEIAMLLVNNDFIVGQTISANGGKLFT
jgi:3-oxoacyl-[acyl-carrier protein] reductase